MKENKELDIFEIKGVKIITDKILSLEKQIKALNQIIANQNSPNNKTHYRKLVKHGPSTIITSLPSKWIKNNNFKAGDTIKIVEINNKLVISK